MQSPAHSHATALISMHSAMSPIVESPPPLGFPIIIFSHEPEGEKEENNNDNNHNDNDQKKENSKNDSGGGGRVFFFSLLDGRTYSPELAAAEAITGRSSLGMSHGWLLTWIPGSVATLVRPFTGLKIELPSLSRCQSNRKGYNIHYSIPRYPQHYPIRKAVVTGSPWIDGRINPNCVVVALVGWYSGVWSCKLADFETAAEEWTEVDPTMSIYSDIVYHKGNVYATNWIGKIYHIENYEAKDGALSQEGKVVYEYEVVNNPFARSYLVSSISGDILIVERIYGGKYYCSGLDDFDDDEDHYVTVGFVVRKLVVVEEEEEEEGRVRNRYVCERVHNLREDEALFVGQCSSSSVSLVAGRGMLRPNCIYFTDDNSEFFPPAGGGHDVGVFDLSDATITSYYTYIGEKSISKSCPPLWYI